MSTARSASRLWRFWAAISAASDRAPSTTCWSASGASGAERDYGLVDGIDRIRRTAEVINDGRQDHEIVYGGVLDQLPEEIDDVGAGRPGELLNGRDAIGARSLKQGREISSKLKMVLLDPQSRRSNRFFPPCRHFARLKSVARNDGAAIKVGDQKTGNNPIGAPTRLIAKFAKSRKEITLPPYSKGPSQQTLGLKIAGAERAKNQGRVACGGQATPKGRFSPEGFVFGEISRRNHE